MIVETAGASMARPTDKELDDLIKAAMAAIHRKDRSYALPFKAIRDLTEMDLSLDDAWNFLAPGLGEIVPSHYCGKRPPERFR